MSKRHIALLALAAASSPLIAQPALDRMTTVREGRLFISPMGEPFRLSADNAEAWFVQADADHDGKITLVEFQADAMRFFAKLDLDHDHEISPSEIENYEQKIAPETGMISNEPIDDNFGQPTQGGDDGGSTASKPKFDAAGQGVTRYSYLALPEPVIAADTDFNRGVSDREFAQAARRRFALLDSNHDGVLTRDELPKLSNRPEGGSGKKGKKQPPQD